VAPSRPACGAAADANAAPFAGRGSHIPANYRCRILARCYARDGEARLSAQGELAPPAGRYVTSAMATLDFEKDWQVLSAGDGQIEPALQALDEALRQWFAALEGLTKYGVTVPPGQPVAPLPPTSPEGVRLTPVAQAPAKPTTDESLPVEAPADESLPIARPVDRAPRAQPPTVGQADAPVADGSPSLEPEPDSDSEDEALLASLDPETACAIRVKRRMGFKKRSIRELLAELETVRAAKEQQRRK
jgi:hypothetical protein